MMRRRLIAVLVTLALAGAACGNDDKHDTAGDATTTTESALTGTITVSAAASLTESFAAIKDAFTTANPGTTVTINFGSSGQLESQLEAGAPADVAAFADQSTMAKLADKQLLAAPAKNFASNRLVIVTKPGNPKGITTLADLATKSGTVALCADTAPCGKYTAAILQIAKVIIPETKITRGQDVKTTLAAVSEGDADAGIVYFTDANAAQDKVTATEIPIPHESLVTYPIAVLAASTNKELAQAFVDYVLSPRGQAVLRKAGFGPR
jgi:molybdate transport system substrate-binding protein